MTFPTMAQVEEAGKRQLGTWLRFLPCGVTEEQKPIMDRMYERFYKELGGWSPDLSKEIGWE